MNSTPTSILRLLEAEPAPPSRYQLAGTDEAQHLQCLNSANLHLYVQRGLTVAKPGLKNFPRQSIFLDGVYTGAPFLDNKARQYSFDHHAECVRAFTLSTCEQAVIMLLEGLPLGEGNWQFYINDPDLDALLAAWVLLNHCEMLKDERELLRAAMPLLRVEGVIDAHGLDKGVFTAIPQDQYTRYKSILDELGAEERQLKRSGEWESTDLLAYTGHMLEAFDRLFLTDTYLHQLLEVEELASIAIEDTRIAVVCRSPKGIYELEIELKERYSKELGVIVLARGNGRYTLRQVDPFLHHDLRDAYKELNRRDPNVADGNEWGGSGDIGGAPRQTGSALSPEEVLDAVQTAYLYESWWKRIRRRIFGQPKKPPVLPS